jgi:hypothetical protein
LYSFTSVVEVYDPRVEVGDEDEDEEEDNEMKDDNSFLVSLLDDFIPFSWSVAVNDLIPKPEDEEVDKEMNDVIIQCFILEFGRVLVVVLSGGRIDFWTLGCGRDKLVKGVKKSVNHGHR